MLALTMTGTALLGVAVVGTGLYQTISPTARWCGHSFTGLRFTTKQLALTYDDGPNDPYSLDLLDVLSRHQVRATFFMIGKHVRQRPDIVRDVVSAGHEIGNHTFEHPLLTFRSEGEIRAELSRCDTALFEVIGKRCRLFRPPFGGRRPAVLRIARELGLEPIMWNVTGFDWDAPPAATIVAKVTKQTTGGSVILLHDGGHKNLGADRSQTVKATDHLIRHYREHGYNFVTITDMMRQDAPS
jgi:peptidoglycan/xylan/chitin deacetylase (PgdA/CDA1 family)